MPRGGKRKGAGRPAGLPDKPKRKAQSEARATGKMPSEIMLENARILQGMAAKYQPKADGSNQNANEEKFIDLLTRSTDAASKAAPYYEYRLAALKVSKAPVDLSELTDNEIRSVLKIHERIAGVRSGDVAGGAGATKH